ncbi:phage tail sheath subtilisin-like domain-containing protein [Kribbella sp. NPDC050820]|uniref:phage tail sheath subtilisin-like domain-containing protein n=1 Tax=Kribbella sp. NPDC050820 TaxID=3155408 RepID=UPI0033C564B7
MITGPETPARPAPLSSYRTPGVRIEWLDAPPQQPVLARTDITGFVGVAERGPLHQPVLVESFEQYIGVFGTGRAQGNLPYAVEGFFANGGTRCWVVRAADPARARFAFLDLPLTTGPDSGGRLHLTATSPGTWGNRIRATLQPDPLHHGRFTLVLRMGAVLEIWRDAGVDPNGRRFVVSVLGGGGSATGSRLVTAAWTPGPWRSERPRTTEHAGTTELGLAGGADGLTTLTPRHLAGSHPPSQDPWGVAALDAIDEIGIVCVPDCWTTRRPASTTPTPLPRDCAHPEAPAARADLPADRAPERLDLSDDQAASLQHDVVAHCEARGDRVALLDAPPGTVPRALEWRAGAPSSAYAAAYYPWLRVVDPDSTTGAVVEVPPSGHVAGICGRVDASPGVHKPPAGEVVELGVDTATPLDDLDHGDLNEAGVNALRAGRTVQVMGARTLSRDSQWTYLNVRRLAIMIERTVERAAAWTVFEPNSGRLQAEITRVVTGVVEEVWRRGMLSGATREQAYRVVCNASNNPVEDVLAGRLVCLVYLNPPPPAEFVVLRIVREPTAVTAAGGGGGNG